MYVAVKGGEKAIDNAHRWLAEVRRGDQAVSDLALDQIAEQLQLSVARVMAEGSLFDPELAALAAEGAVRRELRFSTDENAPYSNGNLSLIHI